MCVKYVLIILLMVFSLGASSARAEGLGPGLRFSALWSGGEEGPGGEAALFLQKALLDRAAFTFGGGYAVASYDLSFEGESLRLFGPFLFGEGKVLLLSFLSVSAGMEWHMACRGDYLIGGSETKLDPGALKSFYSGGTFGVQLFFDSHYILEGRYFKSMDDVLDKDEFPGGGSLNPEHFSLGLSLYF